MGIDNYEPNISSNENTSKEKNTNMYNNKNNNNKSNINIKTSYNGFCGNFSIFVEIFQIMIFYSTKKRPKLI